MDTLKTRLRRLSRNFPSLFLMVILCTFFNEPAFAAGNLLNAFDLSSFVPLVLETMMNVAVSLYKYFVGNGTGIIYLFVYIFLGFYIATYLFKLFIPKDWLEFIGFSGGGDLWNGKITGWSITENVLKPCLRAIIAGVILLQLKPTYITEWLVNPFLEFGSYYTQSILKTVNHGINSFDDSMPVCNETILAQGWLSERSCNFLIQPVHVIAQENNKVIAYGIRYLSRGLLGMAKLVPHNGIDIMNILTGLVLVIAFTSSNFFMALLIIQAIFDFCFALIMYPFKVLVWVAKKSDKWFDVVPVFSQLTDALKKLIITMVACAIILCVNIALVHALFNWNSATFVAAANGISRTNVPTITNIANYFGQQFMLVLSSILTFILMKNIFEQTRKRLEVYSGVSQDLYNEAAASGKQIWAKTKAAPDTAKTLWNAGSKAANFIKNKIKK